MKRILLLTAVLTSIALTSCEAIARKTGISATDLFSITSSAAIRMQAEADRLKAEIKAAQERQRTAAKQPLNVQP